MTNPDPIATPTLDDRIAAIIYSVPCCSSGCDGYVHQDDEHKAIADMKKLVRSESNRVLNEFVEEILYGTPADNPDHIIPFTSVEVAERVCDRYEVLAQWRAKQ